MSKIGRYVRSLLCVLLAVMLPLSGMAEVLPEATPASAAEETAEAMAVKAVSEEPKEPTEEPAAEEPKEPAEEPAAEEPKEPAEEPAAEEPKEPAEEPAAEEPEEPTEEPEEPAEEPTPEMPADGWQQEGDRWLYVKNGEYIVGDIIEVDGKYYAFDYNGLMYDDEAFWFEETHCCALPGGALLTNDWFRVGDAWAYAGADGWGVSGIQTIGGVIYYFRDIGLWDEELNGIETEDDKTYFFVDGIGKDVTAGGWVRTESNGNWYYFTDGVMACDEIKLIDGKSYGFDADGRMYDDELFQLEDVTYYAQSGGALLTDGWVESNGWYYFTDGVMARDEIKLIGGKHYGFDADGRMYDDELFQLGDVIHCAQPGGALLTDGWAESDGDWYYFAGSKLARDEIKRIGGRYYGFDVDGRMYDDELFRLEDVAYCAQSGGALLTNGWFELETGRGYAGADGAAVTGFHTIGGDVYCFDELGVWDEGLNGIVSGDDDRRYLFVDGVGKEIASDGWSLINGDWYYFAGGDMVTGMVREIGGKYYGFDADGRMYDGEIFWIDGVAYRAQSGGALLTKGWFKDGSITYYAGADGAGVTGVQTIGGVLYFFDADGWLVDDFTDIVYQGEKAYLFVDGMGRDVTDAQGWIHLNGEYFYRADGEFACDEIVTIDGDDYAFASDGTMYDGESFWMDGKAYCAQWGGALLTNAWFRRDDGIMYYAGADGAAVTGAQTIEGVVYYFDYDGWLMDDYDGVQTQDGRTYVFVDGVGKDVTEEQGWILHKGERFYVGENGLVREEVLLIDGAYYAFDWDGWMCVSGDFYLDGSRYYAGKDGRLCVNEWRGKSYYGGEAAALTGVQTIEGKLYAFDGDGVLRTNAVVEVDGVGYIAGADGVLTEVETTDGWKDADGYRFYMQDGVLLTDTVAQIDGAYYAFAENGCMYDNRGFLNPVDGAWSRAKEGGSLYYDEWYGDSYFSGYSRCENEMIAIGGKQYFFDENGLVVKNALLTADGEAYKADASGVCTKLADGWAEGADGKWAYVLDGSFVGKGYREIDGKPYYFDDAGMRRTDTLFYGNIGGEYGDFIAREDGTLNLTPGWTTFHGKTYYIGEQGSLYKGLLMLDGAEYYLRPELVLGGDMADFNDTEIDKVYTVNPDGSLAPATKDGFYRVYNGDYEEHYVCYVKDGSIVKENWVAVNGAWYYFDSDGWRVRGYVEINGVEYYFHPDGRMAANEFMREDDGWYVCYATASGALATGETRINGKWYYFDKYNEMCTGVQTYGGRTHVYGADGVWQGELTKAGWNLIAGKYYYMLNGRPLVDGAYVIDGRTYVFDDEGAMFRDAVLYYDYGDPAYLVDASGAAVTGWEEMDGSLYYADPSTALLYYDGEYAIDGETYRFDDAGRMVTGSYVEDGMLYLYDASGRKTDESRLEDGWAYADGNIYYCENGVSYNGWLDDTYYVEDGFVYAGGYYDVWDDAEEESYPYYFDWDGKVIKGDWVNGGWSYAKENGRLACNEWMAIDGDTYYFDGTEKAVGKCWLEDKIYYFDENGKYLGIADDLSGSIKAPDGQSGWIPVDGEYYYARNGYYLSNTVAYIDGAWYGFGVDGVMYASEFAWVDFDIGCPYTGDRYFNADGSMVVSAGWRQIDGRWFYFDGEGDMVSGWQTINGVRYYFDYDYIDDCECYSMVTGMQSIDGATYMFSGSGALNERWSVPAKDGWLQMDGSWYYFRNGEMLRECIHTINGRLYAFGWDGAMLTNTVYMMEMAGFPTYLIDGNGCVVTEQGWQDTDWGMVYVGEGGRLYCEGIYEIEGKLYIFEYSGICIRVLE